MNPVATRPTPAQLASELAAFVTEGVPPKELVHASHAPDIWLAIFPLGTLYRTLPCYTARLAKLGYGLREKGWRPDGESLRFDV